MTRPEAAPVADYRIRPAIALATCATVPLLCALPCILLIPSLPAALLLGVVVAVAVGVLPFRRVRRRRLIVTEDGLVVQRDDYRLVVPWHGITRVQRRTHQWILRVEELVCSDATVDPVDSRGRTVPVPARLADHPAMARVMVSLYDKKWRDGPIGERVRNHGL